jgi:hypothetical protein
VPIFRDLAEKFFPHRPSAERFSVRELAVDIVNSRPDIPTTLVLSRLDAALALIEQYQPWRLRHLRADIAGLLVVTFPSRGAYLPADRIVITELSFLGRTAEFTPAVIASSILHEGVHARIDRMRANLDMRQHPPEPARDERICRRAELAFGYALPTPLGAPVIRRALDSLALSDAEVAPAVDWTAANEAKARADREAIDAWRRLNS